MIKILSIETRNPGLVDITDDVHHIVRTGGDKDGLCTLFIQHTSASLIIQENADPSTRNDLEHWLARQVPENDRLYTHTAEGPDDMPAHIKSMLTSTTLSIPMQHGRLMLGIWQGIYLFEHRYGPQQRNVVLQCSFS